MSEQHFILFHDHTTGMELYNRLKEKGINTTIAPTPRSISKCCGISLLVKERDLDMIRCFIAENNIDILDIASIQNDRDIYRDKYC
jgi:hypothetical protein